MGKEVVVKPLTGENELLNTIIVEEKEATVPSQRLADGKVALVEEIKKVNDEMVLNTKRITDTITPDRSAEKEPEKTQEAKKPMEPKGPEEITEEDREVE